MGTVELILVALIIAVFLVATKVARAVGKGIREFEKAARGIENETTAGSR